MKAHTCAGAVRGSYDCAGCETYARRRGNARGPAYAPIAKPVFKEYAPGYVDGLTGVADAERLIDG